MTQQLSSPRLLTSALKVTKAEDWHRLVPKEKRANRAYRRAILELCDREPQFRATVFNICRVNPVAYVDSFCWQVNPRRKSTPVEPFVLWDFQEDAWRVINDHIDADRDLAIEKSRELGASWLCMILMDTRARFRDWQSFLCISHSEEAVKHPDPNRGLLSKVSFVHEHQPDWLFPHGRPRKKKMGFTYPGTRSTVNGAATSVRSGVGSRATAVFLDEFAKQPQAEAINEQTADVGVRIFNSTHVSTGTEFYRVTSRPDMHKLVMHWSQHPEKKKGLYRVHPDKPIHQQVEVLDKAAPPPADYEYVRDKGPTGGPFPYLRSPWYDREVMERGRDSRAVAMNLDIDPAGSAKQVFDRIQIADLIRRHCRPPAWEGVLDYDPNSAEPRQLVRRAGGLVKLWINPRPNGTVPYDLYGAGCDVATGSGATPSCLSLGSATTGEKVLEYADANIKPEAFATLAVALCRLFCSEGGDGARLAWECPGPGMSFGERVVVLGYRNVYYWAPDGQTPTIRTAQNNRPGFFMSPSGKQKVLADYETAMLNGSLINRSKAAMEETLRFQYLASGQVDHAEIASPNDPSGARVNHGDRTIADALMARMLKELGLGRPVIPQPVEEAPPYNSLAWRRGLHKQRDLLMAED